MIVGRKEVGRKEGRKEPKGHVERFEFETNWIRFRET
jgi:hypothetical protein